VSVGKRIVDGARAGLSTLLDKIRADEAPLQGIAAADLEAELTVRRALRARQGDRRPEDNPRASLAGAGADQARRRIQAAEARARKARAARAEAERAAEADLRRAKAASEDAFRRFREDVRSGRVSPDPAPRSSASAGSSSARPSGSSSRGRSFSFGAGGDAVARAYRTLELADGTPFDAVKAQYRKLMRKVHPDMHAGNPQKQKAATELSMQITQAYNVLDEHLNGRPG